MGSIDEASEKPWVESPSGVNLEALASLLKNDSRVQVAGVDGDGQLRGKVMSKDKFLSIVNSGFGMSSALFGWDMHDSLFDEGTSIALSQTGYTDFIGMPDHNTMRRLPWANNTPFFLLQFLAHRKPVHACGRGIMRKLDEGLAASVAGLWQEVSGSQAHKLGGSNLLNSRVGVF